MNRFRNIILTLLAGGIGLVGIFLIWGPVFLRRSLDFLEYLARMTPAFRQGVVIGSLLILMGEVWGVSQILNRIKGDFWQVTIVLLAILGGVGVTVIMLTCMELPF